MVITIDDIKQENNLRTDLIYTGEILQIPDLEVVAVQSAEPKKETQEIEQVKEKEQEKSAVSISNEEKDLLERLVEAEAKGESYEGKVAVATVVLNRVESSQFPDSITKVITPKKMPFHLFKMVKLTSQLQMKQNKQ